MSAIAPESAESQQNVQLFPSELIINIVPEFPDLLGVFDNWLSHQIFSELLTDYCQEKLKKIQDQLAACCVQRDMSTELRIQIEQILFLLNKNL